MDKTKKLEYQQNVESYLEESQVYDLFERLLKDLIIDRPTKPIEYLIKKLEAPSPTRVFIVGPPGSQRKELALSIAEYIHYTCISAGDLLAKEISKRSEYGKQIEHARKTYSFVDDNIVIELVRKQIELTEREKKSWILEGFPRTRVQALDLQRLGIIPDKVVILEASDETITERIRQNFATKGAHGAEKTTEELEKIAKDALLEYNLNVSGVKELYRGFYQSVQTAKRQDQTLNEIHRLLKLRGKTRAPRRPPRVIILGPPGSGRTAQAHRIASRYGLAYISSSQLLRDEINRKTEIGKVALRCMSSGDMIPDDMIIPLLEQRLKQSDCAANGWVIDGFPKNPEQVEALSHFSMPPSLVVILELSESEVFERLENRKLDPVTGKTYDSNNTANDPEVDARLIGNPEDSHEILQKRLNRWKQSSAMIEHSFRKILLNVDANQDAQNITEIISEVIEN